MSDVRDYGPFEMAHGFDDPRKVEDDMFRIAAQNAADANERLAAVTAERNRLRAALAAIVGVDTREELEQMEAVMRLAAAPAEDKAVTIDAIHALIATLGEASGPRASTD
jgi:hypothetical protein